MGQSICEKCLEVPCSCEYIPSRHPEDYSPEGYADSILRDLWGRTDWELRIVLPILEKRISEKLKSIEAKNTRNL